MVGACVMSTIVLILNDQDDEKSEFQAIIGYNHAIGYGNRMWKRG